MTVTVKLLRPLNGAEIGTEAEYSQADADRLAATGAVEILGKSEPAAPENKAEIAPKNKAAPAKRAKAK